MINKIGIIGSGSWGTAIATQCAQNNSTIVYSLENNVIKEINTYSTNHKYLPNISLHKSLKASNNIEEVCTSNIIIIVVPSFALTNVISNIKPYITDKHSIIVATKGIFYQTQEFFTDYIKKNTQTKNVGMLVGPNFAHEVASNLLSYASLAFDDINLADKISKILTSDSFIFKANKSVKTLQIAGTMKNIIAIATGLSEGYKNGNNYKSYLIAKGLEEIMVLSQILCPEEEHLDASWVGDLILTAGSDKSRNMRFGIELAKSLNPKKLIEDYPVLVEGLNALEAINKLAKKFGIVLPIVSHLHDYINNIKSCDSINIDEHHKILLKLFHSF